MHMSREERSSPTSDENINTNLSRYNRYDTSTRNLDHASTPTAPPQRLLYSKTKPSVSGNHRHPHHSSRPYQPSPPTLSRQHAYSRRLHEPYADRYQMTSSQRPPRNGHTSPDNELPLDLEYRRHSIGAAQCQYPSQNSPSDSLHPVVYHDFAELAARSQTPQIASGFDTNSPLESLNTRDDRIRFPFPRQDTLHAYRHDTLLSRLVSVEGRHHYRPPPLSRSRSPPYPNYAAPSSYRNSQSYPRLNDHLNREMSRVNPVIHRQTRREDSSILRHESSARLTSHPSRSYTSGRNALGNDSRYIRKSSSPTPAQQYFRGHNTSRSILSPPRRTLSSYPQFSDVRLPPLKTREPELSSQPEHNRHSKERIAGRDNIGPDLFGYKIKPTRKAVDGNEARPSGQIALCTSHTETANLARKRRRIHKENTRHMSKIEPDNLNNAIAAYHSSTNGKQPIRNQNSYDKFSRALPTRRLPPNPPMDSSSSLRQLELAHLPRPLVHNHSSMRSEGGVANALDVVDTDVDKCYQRNQHVEIEDDEDKGGDKRDHIRVNDNEQLGSVSDKRARQHWLALQAMKRRRSQLDAPLDKSHCSIDRSNVNGNHVERHGTAPTSVHSNGVPRHTAASASSADASLNSNGEREDLNGIGHLDRTSVCGSDGPSAIVATHSVASSDPGAPASSIDGRRTSFTSELGLLAQTADMAPRVIQDPDVPYPDVTTDFSGVMPAAVGDLIQVWDFATTFSGPLQLSPFKLLHLEQALAHTGPCSLLDALLTRLVRTSLSDPGLVLELAVPASVVRNVTSTNNSINAVLDALPHILPFQPNEVDGDDLLKVVDKLNTGRMAFYDSIDATGRLRILRELVDYTCMSDIIRECVTDTLEHIEEEKRKAREEYTANRKRIENTLKDLRNELHEYKLSNGLLEQEVNIETDKNESSPGENTDCRGEAASSSSKSGPLSRQEKLQLVQKQRKEMEERRVKERGMDHIVARIERARASLKSLKNSRTRIRGREIDNVDSTLVTRNLYPVDAQDDALRSVALGSDRMNRSYWFFEGCGRVWIEDLERKEWAALKTLDSVRRLQKWLSPDRPEEMALKAALNSKLTSIEQEMNSEAQLLEEAKQVKDVSAQLRLTRAGKRKSLGEDRPQNQKFKYLNHFLDYHNVLN